MKSDLGASVRAIRLRMGKTMVEFGRMIGSAHSNVSRYESGLLVPSRAVLLLLYGFAKTGFEKAAIAEALGEKPDDLENSVAKFNKDADELAAELEQVLQGFRTAPETRHRFRELVTSIARQQEIPLWLNQVLTLWLEHRHDPAARSEFDEIATRLQIRMELLSEEPAGAMKRGAARDRGLRVMIHCPETGKPVFTGVTVTSTEFAEGDFEAMEVWCNHCHITHRWNKADAFLESAA